MSALSPTPRSFPATPASSWAPRSVCPSATMDVTFTGSWYDETAEKEGANNLIADGCVLISQHADSMGAPTACEVAGVPNVSYNGSTIAACPNTFIVSSRIDWAPYYEYVINCVVNGEPDRRRLDRHPGHRLRRPDRRQRGRRGCRHRRRPSTRPRPRSRPAPCTCSTPPPSPSAARPSPATWPTWTPTPTTTPDTEAIVDGYFARERPSAPPRTSTSGSTASPCSTRRADLQVKPTGRLRHPAPRCCPQRTAQRSNPCRAVLWAIFNNPERT